MGATGFADLVYTDDSLDSAYTRLCAEAREDYGHDPYNGTISTTNGVTRVLSPHVMSAKGARLVADWAVCEDVQDKSLHAQKWGHANAIAVRSDSAFTLTTKTLTFTLEDLRRFVESKSYEYGDSDARALEYAVREFAIAEVEKAFPLRTVHAMEHTYAPKVKLVTRRATGAAITQFQVVALNGNVIHTADTRAQANAFIREKLRNPVHGVRHTQLGVRAVKMRDGIRYGMDSVTAAETVSAKITVKVTIATPKTRIPSDAKNGWLLYGWASC